MSFCRGTKPNRNWHRHPLLYGSASSHQQPYKADLIYNIMCFAAVSMDTRIDQSQGLSIGSSKGSKGKV